MRLRGLLVTTVVAAVAAVAAPASAAGTGSGASAGTGSAGTASAGTASAGTEPRGCDPLAGQCLLPFPNDWFTVPAATATGRRLALTPLMMPRNAAGTPIGVTEWNRADGFSPGSMLLAQVPGVDLARTGAAPITDIGASLRRDAPIVIVDMRTGRRWPYWAELDANTTDPARQALIIRPARNFLDGHRYAVALRDLRGADGRRLAPGPEFARAAGATLPRHDPLAARQDALRGTLRALHRAGVSTRGLYLAWDFTVASAASTAGQVLRMRDTAFRALGARAPEFTVTSVVEHTPEQDARIAREVTGEVLVPNFLNRPGGPPGSLLNRGPGGEVEQLPGDVVRARFFCQVPHVALTRPGQPALYGHGLLGRPTEIRAGNVEAMAAEHDYVFCAAAWIGMAEEDIPNVVGTFSDFSRFPTVPDRLQQSLLNFLFLGRAMTHRDGLAGHPAFQGTGGRSVIDRSRRLVYDGNSQGGIAGGALVAVAQDITRGVLGVPGMNYSTLLNRSVDFLPFQQILDQTYPDKLDQQLCFALLQMLWDRAEANGYANHLTDRPLPRTPRHRVLLHVAFGDHQVAPVTAEVEARTIGARVHRPAVAPGRNPDVVPYFGIRSLPPGAYGGSGLIIWDSGTPAPPLTNLPPLGPEFGRDPHEDPRASADARRQKAIFLRYGLVVDVCGGAPCTAAPVD